MPDRGYALAKTLGLLLLGYLTWLGGMVGLLPFAAPTLWIVLGVIALGNAALVMLYKTPISVGEVSRLDTSKAPTPSPSRAVARSEASPADPSALLRAGLDGEQDSYTPALVVGGRGRGMGANSLLSDILTFYRRRLRYVIVLELVFVVALLLMANLRAYAPDVRSTEKFMDMAFINSMLNSTQMPPADPWFSGLHINYYYFGHLLAAGLARMTGVGGGVAFNLDIALVFGLTAFMLAGIAYNLVALAQAKSRRTAGAAVSGAGLLAGVLAAVFVLVLGNLDAGRQILSGVKVAGASGTGFNFSWWEPSRVLYDCLPNLQSGGCAYKETINEFPAFSFLLADLHPHVMAMPFVLLAIGLALNLFLIPPTQPRSFGGTLPEYAAQFGLAALILGVLFMLNTWDFPTFVLLALIAFGLNRRRAFAFAVGQRAGREIGRYTAFAVGLGGLALVAFLPFHLTFKAQLRDNYLPDGLASIPVLHTIASSIGISPTRSPLFSYWIIFGLFSAPLLAFWAVKVWPYLRDPYGYRYPRASWGYTGKAESDDDFEAEIQRRGRIVSS